MGPKIKVRISYICGDVVEWRDHVFEADEWEVIQNTGHLMVISKDCPVAYFKKWDSVEKIDGS